MSVLSFKYVNYQCNCFGYILPHMTAATEADRGQPYVNLGETVGVETHVVPAYDDGISEPIHVQFPFGHQLQSTVYVSSFLLIGVMHDEA